MKRIAKFHKVSFEQFKEGWMEEFPKTTPEELEKIYEGIKLPKRATAGSAGYDFFCSCKLYPRTRQDNQNSHRYPGGDG